MATRTIEGIREMIGITTNPGEDLIIAIRRKHGDDSLGDHIIGRIDRSGVAILNKLETEDIRTNKIIILGEKQEDDLDISLHLETLNSQLATSKNDISEAIKALNESLNQAVKLTNDKITASNTTFDERLRSAESTTSTSIKNLDERLSSKISESGSSLSTSISNSVQELHRKVEEAKNNLTSQISSVGQRLTSAEQHYNGVIDAINAGLNSAVEAAKVESNKRTGTLSREKILITHKWGPGDRDFYIIDVGRHFTTLQDDFRELEQKLRNKGILP